MDEDFQAKFDHLTVQMDSVYKSVERLRKFFMWTLIITAAMFILPLIGLLIAIPWYLSMISSLYAF
ncbi:MAG: hypothetical protein V1738_02485 [Patescibacteria group bacterium]